MKSRFFCLLILAGGLFVSCKKSECSPGEKGVLKDYQNLDGCTWVIELENGNKLVPINLEDFIKSPKDQTKIRLSYNDDIEIASICMSGKTARINCLEILK